MHKHTTSRGTHRVAAVLLSGFVCASALAQDAKPVVLRPAQKAAPQPRATSGGGLIGQRAKLPNVLGRNRSLPLERSITLPGLPAGTPGSTPAVVPAVVGRPVSFYDDEGTRIEGKYEDGDFSLHFHLGTGSNLLYPYGRSGGYYVHDGSWYYDPTWYYYRSGGYYSNRPVDGVLTQRVDYTLRSPQVAQPQPAPAAPAKQLTAIERATSQMQAEELDKAIESFRDHLAGDPEDVTAMRSLGVAMIEHNRMEDGIAMIAMAYRTDPLLGRDALDLDGLGLGEARRYDKLLGRVLRFAKRVDSGSAHLAGVMLLQADGKLAGAGRVLDRAEDAGLSDDIVGPLRRELGVPASTGG